MRIFQFYKLKVDQQLADAARKILEHSGIDKFCRDAQSPDEKPVLLADQIRFANKELAKEGRSRWDVCILSKDIRTQPEFMASKDLMYHYGDTNADGCEREMWMLLIWAILNGHDQEMMRSYVNGQGNLHDIEDDYEEIFGVKLSGDTLRDLCRGHQIYQPIGDVMEKYDIPFTIDDLQACRSLAKTQSTILYFTRNAGATMISAICSSLDNQTAKIAESILLDMFSKLSLEAQIGLVTLDDIHLNGIPKDARYNKFVEDDAVDFLCSTIRTYESTWEKCGGKLAGKNARSTKQNTPQNELTSEQKQEIKKKVEDATKDITLFEIRDYFLQGEPLLDDAIEF